MKPAFISITIIDSVKNRLSQDPPHFNIEKQSSGQAHAKNKARRAESNNAKLKTISAKVHLDV